MDDGDIVFHTTLLVPHRIDVQAEFVFPPVMLARVNAAMAYADVARLATIKQQKPHW